MHWFLFIYEQSKNTENSLFKFHFICGKIKLRFSLTLMLECRRSAKFTSENIQSSSFRRYIYTHTRTYEKEGKKKH